MEFNFNQDEKEYLLRLARETISKRLGLQAADLEEPPSEKFQQKVGAFVTLHRAGQLRGCIGYVTAKLPLTETIKEMSISAAFRDPRFEPVRAAEMPSIEIEISVLSPLFHIDDIGQIKVGRHGLLIQNGSNSGLLLPQVPVEQGWDREAYLEGLCKKAGLSNGCWRDQESKLYAFTAEVFSENSG